MENVLPVLPCNCARNSYPGVQCDLELLDGSARLFCGAGWRADGASPPTLVAVSRSTPKIQGINVSRAAGPGVGPPSRSKSGGDRSAVAASLVSRPALRRGMRPLLPAEHVRVRSVLFIC
jgi:hypothetical protein